MLKAIKVSSLNKSAKLAMIIFTFSHFFRFLNGATFLVVQFIHSHSSESSSAISGYFNSINIVATILGWVVLYYFVFEVQDVQDRLAWNKSVLEFAQR